MSVTLVLSDIHANIWALNAVLMHAKQYDYDEIWFLGDLWGYGPKPFQVWEKLFGESVPVIALAGNHDWEVCAIHAGNMRPDARAVARYHRQLLSGRRAQPALDAVRTLPVMCSPRQGIYLAHGEVLSDVNMSIRSNLRAPLDSPKKISENFELALQHKNTNGHVAVKHSESLSPARLFAVGQTHEQRLWEWNSHDFQDGFWEEKNVREYSLENIEERPIGFNPGSVGFPRADSGCPGYAIIDWTQKKLFFKRVFYDVEELKQAMAYGPYRVLIEDQRFFIAPHCQEAA